MLRSMKLTLLAAAAFLLASPVTMPLAERLEVDEDGAPFVPAAQTFADPAACIAHLTTLVSASRPPAFDAAAGPYRIADGDMRAHRVRAQHWGHEIEEFRCSGAVLSSRRWSRSMSGVKPFTIDDIRQMKF